MHRTPNFQSEFVTSVVSEMHTLLLDLMKKLRSKIPLTEVWLTLDFIARTCTNTSDHLGIAIGEFKLPG